MSDIYGRHRKDARQADKRAFSTSKRKLQNYHQWEVGDLRAAGLNPILSAGGPTPGLSGAATMPSGGDLFGGAVASARDVVETGQKLATARSNVTSARNMAEESFHRAGKEGFLSSKAADEALIARTNVDRARVGLQSDKADMLIRGSQVPAALAVGEFQRTKAGKYTKQFGQAVENILGPVKPYIGFGVNTGRRVNESNRRQQNRIRDRR